MALLKFPKRLTDAQTNKLLKGLTADPEHLCPALRAFAFGSFSFILQSDCFCILHFPFCLALHAISCNHLAPPLFLCSHVLNSILTVGPCPCQAHLEIYASFCCKNTIYIVDMPGQPIAPIVPNMGGQEAAVAGSAAVIFTATDKKVIEERGGRTNRNLSFLEALKERPLTPEVENEETNVKPHQDVKELEGRLREHQRMLKHSTLYVPREQVEIKNELPDSYEEPRKIVLAPEIQPLPAQAKTKEETKVIEETAAIAKELKLDPSEIFDKFALEQKELYSLISRIKDLHLKRLLTENQSAFKNLTEEIKKETLASAKAEAQVWLEAQLDKLTLDAAEYKLNLLKSLQSMEFNPQRKKIVRWLKTTVADISRA